MAASLVVLAPAVLAGCSPARTAVVGIGLDSAGELVAAVATCDADELTAAFLTTFADKPVVLGSWSRGSPLLDDETWRLRDSSGSPWRPVGAPLPDLDDQVSYSFGLASRNGGEQSNWITFTGADLDRVTPGHVLVEHGGLLAVIDIDDLDEEHCGY